MRKGLVLVGGSLAATMHGRASWVLQRWDKTKVERRAAGGRHGRATGTRKGPTPRFTVAAILPHYGLPPGERKARVIAETGMSESRYYQLLREVPAALDRIQERSDVESAVRPTDEELQAFLNGDDLVKRIRACSA
ncbi:hypothetical protein ACI3KY_14560 [Microbacterium sp. ZW T2_14]|uniref:hypothetical protein n=1 Tax=Microbacterium sp. ZW T2_14 TaxID=3378079 RepID=UPI003853646F